jgi:hypothetical protein
VVLADPEEVHADLVRKHALLDDVADRLGVRVRAVLSIVRQITKRVEAEDERESSTLDLGDPVGVEPGRDHAASLSGCAAAAS